MAALPRFYEVLREIGVRSYQLLLESPTEYTVHAFEHGPVIGYHVETQHTWIVGYNAGCQVFWEGSVSATFSAEPPELGHDGLPVSDGLRMSSLVYDVSTSTEYIRRDAIRSSKAAARAASPSSVDSSSPTALSASRISTTQDNHDAMSSPTLLPEYLVPPSDGVSPMKQDPAFAPETVGGAQKRKATAQLPDDSFGLAGGRRRRSKSVTIQDSGVKILDFADSTAQSGSENIDWEHCCVPPPCVAIPSVSERSLRVLEVSLYMPAWVSGCLGDSRADHDHVHRLQSPLTLWEKS